MPAMRLALLMAALLSPWPRAADTLECMEECGGVKIPYPFGIGRGCYLETNAGDGGGDEPFNVTCSNRDTDGALQQQAEPVPMVDGMQLLDIDVAGGRVRVYSRVSSRCHSAATSPSSSSADDEDNTWGYESATFRVSGTENVLTVVGCDVLAYIGTQEGGVENRYVVGCNASCPSVMPPPSSMASGGSSSSCNGTDGCCQMQIKSSGIRSFVPSFVTDDENRSDGSGSSSGGPCRYAFLVEKDRFKFRTSYATNRELAGADGKRLPLVLDWAVGNMSCVEAQRNNATYACRSDNHRCENSTNGPGYLCKCKDGYRGNAYRNNGCE